MVEEDALESSELGNTWHEMCRYFMDTNRLQFGTSRDEDVAARRVLEIQHDA